MLIISELLLLLLLFLLRNSSKPPDRKQGPPNVVLWLGQTNLKGLLAEVRWIKRNEVTSHGGHGALEVRMQAVTGDAERIERVMIGE